MAIQKYGQTITFGTEVNPDDPANYGSFTRVRVTSHQRTIKQIAAAHGHREMARIIAQINDIRDIRQKLRPGRMIRVPATLAAPLTFEAYPQDMKRPIIKDGYAIFTQVPRYGEKSITSFQGYNALAMEVYLSFEGYGIDGAGVQLEKAIRALERMAGRGPGFIGAASGPPAIVRVSTTDAGGNVVPLVPDSYQWTEHGGSPNLLWRIGNIAWDGGDLSDDGGKRVRTTCTVSLVENTPFNLTSSVSARSKANNLAYGHLGNTFTKVR